MIFAIIQDIYWNNWKEVPFWLEVPNVMPAWISAISFFFYLGLIQEFGQQKALLLSIAQFQWIFNNTYAMFVQTYMEMSFEIYLVYDGRKMN